MSTFKYEVEVKLTDLEPVQDLVSLLDTAVMLLQGITPHTKVIGQSWFDSRGRLLVKIDKACKALAGEDE